MSIEMKLNTESTLNYNSFASSSHLADGSCLSDPTTKNDITPLKQVSSASESPELLKQTLKEEDTDGSSKDIPLPICVVPAIFALTVTIALILQIYLAEYHDRCTEVGQRVLIDGGSSVDAAVAAALCLGVVHPHASGIGGGGVIMIHDIYRNKSKVVNFLGTAPGSFRWEMLQNISELQTGLLVGVPGMLMGLHHAHRLYGRLLWENVVSRAADVAREGFNVSHALSNAITKVQGEQLSARFRHMFIPQGRPLTPGEYLRMPSLAAALEAGLSGFYHGNLSQEMEDEVRINGGILTRQDISNYSAEEQKPVEGQYNGFIIQVPSLPSAAAALTSVLKFLEEFHLNENITEYPTHKWTSEALRRAFHTGIGMDDRITNSSVTELLSHFLSKNQTEVFRRWMNQSNSSASNALSRTPQTELMGGQVVVVGPDNHMVSVASSLSRTFGSRIVTPSGIILNSLLLQFNRPHVKEQHENELEKGEGEKNPQFFLMPTFIISATHRCGAFKAGSYSSGPNSLEMLTQMLNYVLFFYKDRNNSSIIKGHHLQPDERLFESEFPEERVQFLDAKGHKVQRMKAKSAIWVIQKNNNIISVTKRTR